MEKSNSDATVHTDFTFLHTCENKIGKQLLPREWIIEKSVHRKVQHKDMSV